MTVHETGANVIAFGGTGEEEPEVELTPEEIITFLHEDLKIAQAALRKIVGINPAFIAGGSSNKNFGRKYEKAFEQCRGIADKALHRMEVNLNE